MPTSKTETMESSKSTCILAWRHVDNGKFFIEVGYLVYVSKTTRGS